MLGLVVAGATGLLIAELAARFIIRRGGYYPWIPGQRELLKVDRETHPQLPISCEFVVNSRGERGDEPRAQSGEYYALAVGGSAVESYLLDQSAAWPYVVQRELSKAESLTKLGCTSVHVGNIGKSGVDSSSLDYMLGKVLPLYKNLDLILIMVGASDVLRWLENGAPNDKAAELLKVTDCFACHPEVRFGIKPKELGLSELFRRYRDSRPRIRERAARWLGKARKMRANAKEVIDIVPPSDVVMDAFRRHFSSVIAQCRSVAKRVIVVGQPWFESDSYSEQEEALFWNGGVGKAYKEEVTIYYSSRVISELMKQVDDETKRLCAEYSIEHVDLRDEIENSVASYRDQFHLLPNASIKAAQAVGKQILYRGQLG